MLRHNQQIQQILDQMKQEIATELGIEISPDMTTRNAGRIGGEMTQRLVQLGETKLLEMQNQQVNQKQFNQKHSQLTNTTLKNHSKQHSNHQQLH